ncbi:MAG: ASKHA domain-containing protein [Thermoguttaceae bacterium]|nr:ASKHA domain-containing protein [Thermoguttaceae bacterium]
MAQVRIHFPNQRRTVEAPEDARLSDVIRTHFPTLSTMPCGGRGLCGKCTVQLGGGRSVLACQTQVEPEMRVLLTEPPVQKSLPILTCFPDEFLENLRPDPEMETAFSVAFDLGTTTLAAVLLKGKQILARTFRTNPQRAFGADVISRIQYAGGAPDHPRVLQSLLLKAVREMTVELISGGTKSRSELGAPSEKLAGLDQIKRLVFSGNTTMEETALGLDLQTLAAFPFRSAPELRTDYSAGDPVWNGGLNFLAPETSVRVFPVIGPFVGGDITAGLLVTSPPKKPAFLIDLGTNGEMVLETDAGRIGCATAAGPCFEGAEISCGMCAEPGAICRVWSENGQFRVATVQDAPICGICGSGLVELTVQLLDQGLLTADGRLLEPEEIPAGAPNAHQSWASRIQFENGELVFRLVGNFCVTQEDFRKIQLAAGAIRTGVTLLLRRSGIPPSELASFRVAGGFGRNIRPACAQRLGLVPAEIPLDRVEFIGNSSLAGAVQAAVSTERWAEAETLACGTQCVDLSQEEGFSDVFMDSMFWP